MGGFLSTAAAESADPANLDLSYLTFLNLQIGQYVESWPFLILPNRAANAP